MAPAAKPIRVRVFPDYRTANPYQRLLYDDFDPAFAVDFEDWRSALAKDDEPVGIFHLHWEDAIYRMAPGEDEAKAQAQAFIDALQDYRNRGGISIWTVHNRSPHDGRYLAVHDALCEALAEIADIVVVHHATGARFAHEARGIPHNRLVTIPHGNYRPLPANLLGDRPGRRLAAGYGPGDRVVLLFGRLDSYKGGEELIDAFAQTDNTALKLAIAGKAVAPLDDALAGLAEPVRQRISVDVRFIPEEEVPAFFDLADFVALPYRSILTSGTAMLALSRARPVIAPALDGLLEWVRDGQNGYVYEPDQPGSLVSVLNRVASSDHDTWALMVRAAEQTSLGFDWHGARTLLAGIYARLTLDHRPPRLVGADDWFVLGE
ncbi:MAG: glycosyltransferase [Geminicoccaceae bacterium]